MTRGNATSGLRRAGEGAEAVAAYGRAVDHWRLLTGAALVGIASRALELGVDYVMHRRAFGVLIAGFQTIQHRLADNATAVEGARVPRRGLWWPVTAGPSTRSCRAACSTGRRGDGGLLGVRRTGRAPRSGTCLGRRQRTAGMGGGAAPQRLSPDDGAPRVARARRDPRRGSTAGAMSTPASPGRSSRSAPVGACTSTGGRRRPW